MVRHRSYKVGVSCQDYIPKLEALRSLNLITVPFNIHRSGDSHFTTDDKSLDTHFAVYKSEVTFTLLVESCVSVKHR